MTRTRLSRDFLGIGWKFPLQVTPAGHIARARYEQRIEESIFLILSTSPGERPMRPGFGCGIHDLVFSLNDATTASLLAYEVREALVEWEPRAEVLGVHINPEPGEANKLLIQLEYRVRLTNNVFNLVYPFYLENSGA